MAKTRSVEQLETERRAAVRRRNHEVRDGKERQVHPNGWAVEILMTNTQQRRFWGIFCICLSGLLIYVAYTEKVHPADHQWILYLPGGLFSLAGLHLLLNAKERLSALISAIIAAGLSVLGFYVAFGDKKVLGGIPFVPESWNQLFGKILFGGGAALTAAFALLLFSRAFKSNKKKSGSASIE